MTYDYDGILTELKNRLALLTDWSSTIFHGTYERLLSVIAYIIDKLVYIAEFLYVESNWTLAQKRSSLMAKVDFLGYRPHRKIGASGNVSFSADAAMSPTYTYTGYPVTIPQWTQFTDSTGLLNVYSTETVLYNTGKVGDETIPVVQGTPKEFTYIATGIANEVIYLYSDSIDNEEIYVYKVDSNNNILTTFKRCEIDTDSNNIPYERLPFIQDLVTYYYCEIKNGQEFDQVKIIFSDGILSRKLNAGDRILIKYAETLGDTGNIEALDTINVCKSTLLDTNGNVATLYFSNLEGISDGSAIESITDIRNNASNLFAAARVCTSYSAWVSLLENNSLIYKVKVWSSDDEGVDDTTTTTQNKVYVTAISNSGDALTSAQQTDITLNYLKQIKSPTEIVSWQTLKKVYAIFKIVAGVTNTPQLTIEQKIADALEVKFGILHTDFKTNIYQSNYIATIDNLEEIVYHTTEIYSMDKSTLASQNNYTLLTSYTSSQTTTATDQIYIVPDTLELWASFTQSGVIQAPVKVGYDVSGVIQTVAPYATSGTVVYSQNQVSYSCAGFTSGSTFNEVGLMYKTKDGNGNRTADLRLSAFDSITDVDDTYNSYTFTYV